MIRAPLGHAAHFIRDGTHGSPARAQSGIPVLSAMNVKNGRLNFETDRYTSKVEFEAFSRRVPLAVGDILLTIVGTIGRAAVIEQVRPLVFQRSVAIVRPNEEILDSRFLYHVTQSADFQTQLDRASNKSSQAGVYLGKLAEVLVPLPPIPEQRRIASILDKVDALRAKRREALAQLDRLAQSIFVEMFGDPVRNDKSWPTKAVAGICELVRGSSPRPQGDPRYFGGPVPRLMVADITRDGWQVTPRIDSLTVDGAKRSRPVKAGTVVMAVSGNVGLVSRLAVDACVHDGFVAFTALDEATCTSEYLLSVLHYSKSKHEKSKAGAIFINLTTSDIKAMELPVPPLELQHRYVSRLSAVREMETRVVEGVSLMNALFESVQHRAFRGAL